MTREEQNRNAIDAWAAMDENGMLFLFVEKPRKFIESVFETPNSLAYGMKNTG